MRTNHAERINHMRLFSTILVCLLTAACSDQHSPDSTESAGAPELDLTTSAVASQRGAPIASTNVAKLRNPSNAIGQPSRAPAISGRTGELVNPDDHAMIFLYFDLAGIQPPLDQWVDQDHRVLSAAAFDKAAVRTAVRGELESAAAAVRGVGFLRVTMNANLSDYDPTYGEFSVRALAPSSTLEFQARSNKVALRFANGRVAQVWRVPPDEAQIVRDKIGGYGGGVTLDVLLRISSVQPSHAGGTITAEVIEYEMRETRRGLTVGRVQVAK